MIHAATTNHQPDLPSGPEPLRLVGDGRRNRAGKTARPTAPGTNPPGRDYGAAVFGDPAELDRLARLSLDDPAAFAREKAALKKQGGSVRDLDMAIAARVAALRADRPEVPKPAPPSRYVVLDGCVHRRHPTPSGVIDTPLCNFAARVTADVTVDDGAERRRFFRVAGRLATGEELPEAEVPADEFARMDWPITRWGHQAVVFAGPGAKDHLRAALQLLSPGAPAETVYAHTGWRRVGGGWAYLHAGGAVGAAGPVPGVRVALPDPLAPFRLPDPPAGDELVAAVRAGLGLLDGLAPDPVAFLLLIAPYRAVLGGADYAVHLFGRTGSFKSELAALAQQHHGAGLDARHLPASWSGTGNALEGLAFAAKDTLLVVDDFCPAGGAGDVHRLHRDADRLLRAQGNGSGRLRMTADAALRSARPPRGLVLSTGEDVPRGHSLRARLLTVEVSREDVAPERLTECQRDAAAGLYATSLMGFVRHLAPGYEQVRGGLAAERAELLAELGGGIGTHARTPQVAADLAVGLRHLLAYARAVGAVTAAEAAALERRGRAAVLAVAGGQAELHRSADPADQFVRLLSAVLTSGRGHLAGDADGPPADAGVFGWRVVGGTWCSQGRAVGWVAGGRVYLEPEAAYAEAQRLAAEQGELLAVGKQTLWKRLHEGGRLTAVDDRGGKVRFAVRKTLGGAVRSVLALSPDSLFPPAGGQSGHPGGPDPAGPAAPADGGGDPTGGPGHFGHPPSETGGLTGGDIMDTIGR